MILLGSIASGLLAAVAAVALMRPTLRRLAVRNARRHRGEALLVVVGCMLGTAIVTGSLLVGDMLDASLRARAPERLGPTDVIISSYAVPVAEAVETTLTVDPPASADGVLPMVTADATLASPEAASAEGTVVPNARLVEVNFERAASFGGDEATGLSGPTPEPGEVVLGEDTAAELGAEAGSLVEVYAYGQFRLLEVDRVLPRVGVAGYATEFDVGSMNAFVAPGTIAELAYSSSPSESVRPPERLLLVSAVGGVFPGSEPTDALLEDLRDRLKTLVGYEIVPVKRDLLDAAQEEGDSFAELFLSLGVFAVLAGITLLVNMLVMVAEERRRQLGIMRALGMRRSHMVAAFVLEGAIYSVAAAVLGALAGIGVAGLIVLLARGVFSSAQRGGLDLRIGFEPGTVLLGFLGGVIISLVVVTAASAWIGRMSIVEAIEDTARPARPRPRGAAVLAVTILGGAAFLIAAAVSIAAGDDFGALAFPCLAGASLAAAALQVSARRPAGHRRLRSLAVSTVAVAVAVWVVLAFPLLGLDVDNATLFVVQGLALTLCAVVLLSQQGERLGSAVRRVGGATGLVLRVALSYPSARRFRTGSTLLAYGLIVFTLVFSSVLSGVFSSQIEELTAEEAGGFDVLVSTSSADPVSTEELMAFEGVEDVATLYWTVAGFRVGSSGTFEDWPLSGFGPGFVAGGPPALQAFDRDEYPSEAAVWEAVASDPSLAVADVAFLESGGGPPEGNVEVGDEIQVKAPATGETVSRRVVAISAAGAAFSGVMVSQNSFAELVEEPVGNRHYVAVPESASPEEVAAKLERAFLPNGLEARTFSEVVREALRSQEGFFNLIEGYLALGLFVGIAGLGVVMVRAVRERRRQIGVLRALGLSARAVRAAFLLESGLVALEGVLIGTMLALATSYQLIVNSTAFGDTDVSFAVPWAQLAALLASVLIASLLVTLVAAARAAAIPPATALRTVEEGAT